MIIPRTIAAELKRMMRKFPVVTLTGPRQSGKSTLLKTLYPKYKYISLEDPDVRLFCRNDPRGFLETYPDKTIIDEAQNVPELFSYLQTHIDNAGREGMYILAGSQNFLMMEAVSQSLAGRTAVLKLLPFSHEEMSSAGILKPTLNEEIFYGAYPRIYDKNIHPTKYFPGYIQTYVERDVRLLKNVGDVGKFIQFVKLCAGRIGQLLNLSSLAGDCGVASSTISAWMSVLETSYIAYLLKPAHANYSKRLVKSPKLYFYDTGLACALLDIKSAEQVGTHFLKGGLFENLIINRVMAHYLNNGEEPEILFWRDKIGNEVDLLYGASGNRRAVEIKASATFSPDFFKGLSLWASLSDAAPKTCSVIYSGKEKLATSAGKVIPWNTWKIGE